LFIGKYYNFASLMGRFLPPICISKCGFFPITEEEEEDDDDDDDEESIKIFGAVLPRGRH
jgi:hypothetical protein